MENKQGQTVARLMKRLDQVDNLIEGTVITMKDTDERRFNMRLDEDKRKEAAAAYDNAANQYRAWIKLQIILTKSYDEAVKLDSTGEQVEEKPLSVLEQLRGETI